MPKATEWTLTCGACGKSFTAYQNNPNQLPKYCGMCKAVHHGCPTCGKPVGISRIYCSPKCAQSDPNNEAIKLGHKAQGMAIMGDNNPAKRKEVREILSQRASETSRNREFHVDGRGNLLKSLNELLVAQYLQIMGFDYVYEKQFEVGSSVFRVDFYIPDSEVIIEVFGFVRGESGVGYYQRRLGRLLHLLSNPIVVIMNSRRAQILAGLETVRHFEVVGLDDKEPRLETIRMENVDMIDYAHVLPFHQGKCNRYHAHSSLIASVEVTGVVGGEGTMVMDFGDLKALAKEVAKIFDHKLVIGERYVQKGKDSTTIKFITSSGEHCFELPTDEVTCVEGEATIETMVELYTSKLLEKMPTNVIQITTELSEGIGKSAMYSLGVDALPRYHMDKLGEILQYYKNLKVGEWK